MDASESQYLDTYLLCTPYSRYLCQEDQHAVSCVSLFPYQTPTRVLAWCLDRMDAEVMHSDGDGGGPAEGSVAHKYANVHCANSPQHHMMIIT